MTSWKKFVQRIISPKKRVKIAVVGKYIELQDAYKSIYESLTHAAAANDCGIDSSAGGCEETRERLRHVDGVARRSGPRRLWRARRGGQDTSRAICPRKRGPYLGLCLGMQVATIEFARNVCGARRADSTEFDQIRRTRSYPFWKSKRRSPTKAHRCVWAVARRHRRGNPRPPGVWENRDRRAAPAPLRIQHGYLDADGGQGICRLRPPRPTAVSWK